MKVVENSEVRSKEAVVDLSIDRQIEYIQSRKDTMEKIGLEYALIEQEILKSLQISKWVIEAAVEQLKKEDGNQPTEPGQVEELVDTLKKMKHIIRGWHGIGHRNPEEEKAMWEVYDRKSPEMKMINDVLAKYSDYDDGKEASDE